MKKWIAMALSFYMLMALVPAVNAGTADPDAWRHSVIFQTDFEDGIIPSNIGQVPNNGGIIELKTIDAAHGKSLSLEKATGNNPYLQFNGTGYTSYALEADIYFSDSGVGVSSNICGSAYLEGPAFQNGSVTLRDGRDNKQVGSFGKGWYHFRLEFDTDSDTYSFYWGEENNVKQVADNWNMSGDISNFWGFRLFNWGSTGFYAVDNVVLENYIKVETTQPEAWRCDTLIDTDFEDGQKPSAVTAGNVETVDAVHGRSLRFTKSGARVTVPGDAPMYVMETDLWISNASTGFGLCFDHQPSPQTGNQWANGPQFGGGKATAATGSLQYTAGWHHVVLTFDTEAYTYDFAMDGTTVATDVAPTANTGKTPHTMNQFVFNIWTDNFYLALDNLRVYGYYPETADLTASITSPEDGSNVFLGEEFALTASVTPGTDNPESVEFFVNDTSVGKAEAEPFTCNWVPSTAGTAEIYAVVSSGEGRIKTESVTVHVQNVDLPTVTFAELTEGSYQRDELQCVVVNASVGSGKTIDRVELYCGDVLFAADDTAPYEFNLSGLPVGSQTLTARAYTNENRRAEVSCSITIETRSNSSELLFFDFENGTGDLVIDQKDGKIWAEQIDAAHGNSLKIQRSTASGGSSNNYIEIRNPGSESQVYAIEADVYFPSTNVGASSNIRGTNGRDSEGVGFDSGRVQLYKGNDSQVVGSFGANQWHHFRLVFDAGVSSYDFYWDGAQVASGWPITRANPLSGFQLLRMFNWKAGGDYYALDNLKLEAVINYPESVTAVYPTGGKVGDAVTYDAGSITAVLSGTALAESVNAETVSLRCGGKAVELESVAYNAGSVIIKPRYHLVSNEQYEVVLSGKVKAIDGTEIGKESATPFVTAEKPLDVTSASFQNGADGTVFRANVKNETSAEQSFYLVVNVWKGDKLMRTAASAGTLAAGARSRFDAPAVSVGAGERAEAIIVTSLAEPKGVTAKVFSCQK